MAGGQVPGRLTTARTAKPSALVAEFGRSLGHRRVANPAEADQQQQRENEDCGHSPTSERRKASADEEDSEQEAPAPDPPEAGIEQYRAYRIGIE
jgi:hypothetical protein